MFGSVHDNEYILLLWDGTSYVDSLPDAASFIRIVPELRIYSPFSTWVTDDLLAFEASTREGSFVQIYTWDRQDYSNISQKPGVHNGGAMWSNDGYWAFITFFSAQQSLYIRDGNNDPVFETYGQYVPAWSSGGSLVFCSRDGRSGWKLSRWDRVSVSTLVRGDEIFAQWQSGQETVCSSG